MNITDYFNFTGNIPLGATVGYGNMMGQPSGYGGMNIMMMTMIPLMTTLFSNTISALIKDIHSILAGILKYIYSIIVMFTNRYVLRRYSGYNKIYIEMSYNSKSKSY